MVEKRAVCGDDEGGFIDTRQGVRKAGGGHEERVKRLSEGGGIVSHCSCCVDQ